MSTGRDPLAPPQVCKRFACNNGFQSMIVVSPLGAVTIMAFEMPMRKDRSINDVKPLRRFVYE